MSDLQELTFHFLHRRLDIHSQITHQRIDKHVFMKHVLYFAVPESSNNYASSKHNS